MKNLLKKRPKKVGYYKDLNYLAYKIGQDDKCRYIELELQFAIGNILTQFLAFEDFIESTECKCKKNIILKYLNKKCRRCELLERH